MASPPPDLPRTDHRAPRLVRARQDRVVAGVAGGLGRHLGVDPLVLRIVFVVLALAGGSGLLAYLICWLVIPEEVDGDARPAAAGQGSSVVVGAALVGLGVVLLVNQFLPVLAWRYVGPAVLVALGVLLLTRGREPR